MKHSSTIAFDDHGALVASVDPVYPGDETQDPGDSVAEDEKRIRREAVIRFLLFIAGDDFSVDAIGKRSMLAMYSFRLDGGPKTHAALAEKFGLTRSAISYRMKSFEFEMGHACPISPNNPQKRQRKQAHRKS